MAITNGYATLADVKGAFRITDNVDDALIELSIESASREIDGYCERVFYNAGTATRVYIPTDTFYTETDDIISVTTLKTSSTGESFDTTWSASGDYQLEPLNGISGGLIGHPATRIRAIGSYLFPLWSPKNVNSHEATVQVVGVFGWSAVPTAIRQATIIQASRLFKRLDTPLGISYDELGSLRVGRVDPDVEKLVMPFRKVRMA
ncbi:phage head-tail connector protein [Planktomarina sp.]|uniref:phage head-tail connector protein n=1 Tax=Planktomarina sp. TaxID=2024851 RepID=UPI003260EAC4